MNERAGRGVKERLLITGTLVLDTPVHLGNGKPEMLTDMPLLRDARDRKLPLLTGASLTGALRAYVREYARGYHQKEDYGDLTQQLFGSVEKAEGQSVQSWLIVDDALGASAGIELRDGVGLDEKTRTAADEKKYDIELLKAGTTFNLSFELLIPDDASSDHFTGILALALRGLESGEIGLGMRKRRGFGRCHVCDWRVARYDMHTKSGLLAWLAHDRSQAQTGNDICALLGVQPAVTDVRERFVINATLDVVNSLLIRAAPEAVAAPDMVHLRSYRPESGPEAVPILSGTSVAGALRARTTRIANTMLSPSQAAAFVEGMFGRAEFDDDHPPVGSRVIVEETVIEHGIGDRVQQRVKIDRFTGGAYPTALFAQQPHFGGQVRVKLELRNPQPAEIGLLLLTLKDLWMEDLPLGGEQSVGRGRLRGLRAELQHQRPDNVQAWTLERDGEGDETISRLTITGDRDALEAYVNALYPEEAGND